MGPVDALHWFLSDRELMWQAYKELLDDHGHRGGIVAWHDVSGELVYRFEVNDALGNSASCVLGQHQVLPTNGRIAVYDADVFNALNHVEPPSES